MIQGNQIVNVSFRFGLIGAGLSIFLFSLLNFLGKNPLLIPPFLDFRIILFPVFLVFSIRDFKEYRNNGILHFWQGISIGVLVILSIALIMGMYIFIFGKFIDPSFLADYIDGTRNNILQARENIVTQIGEKAYQKTLEILPTTSLSDLALDYLIKSLPFGLLLTILISLVLRKNPNQINYGKI